MKYYLISFIFFFNTQLNYIGCSVLKENWSDAEGRFKASNTHDLQSSRQKMMDQHVTWTDDPNKLLGLYEEEAPVRNSIAYFMTKNNTQVTIQVGSVAALQCQVFDVAEHETVSWIRRRDHHIITVGTNTYSNDDRFQVTHSEKNHEWILHIHFAQPRDTGIYECQVSSHPPMGVLKQLNVIEAITEISGQSERYIQVGSSVHLQCTIRDLHEPPTYVFWYHGENMINYDKRRQIVVNKEDYSSELKIDEVTGADSGNYTCHPSNARPSYVAIHVIIGEMPAAMQGASGTGSLHTLSVVILASLLPVVAS